MQLAGLDNPFPSPTCQRNPNSKQESTSQCSPRTPYPCVLNSLAQNKQMRTCKHKQASPKKMIRSAYQSLSHLLAISRGSNNVTRKNSWQDTYLTVRLICLLHDTFFHLLSHGRAADGRDRPRKSSAFTQEQNQNHQALLCVVYLGRFTYITDANGC